MKSISGYPEETSTLEKAVAPTAKGKSNRILYIINELFADIPVCAVNGVIAGVVIPIGSFFNIVPLFHRSFKGDACKAAAIFERRIVDAGITGRRLCREPISIVSCSAFPSCSYTFSLPTGRRKEKVRLLRSLSKRNAGALSGRFCKSAPAVKAPPENFIRAMPASPVRVALFFCFCFFPAATQLPPYKAF